MAAQPGQVPPRRARTLAVMLGVAACPFRGSVVDWLNLPHFAWTFNVADAAVTCAAVLIGILTLLGVRIAGTSRADAARDAPGERATGTP